MVDMFKSNQMVTSHQPSPASSPLGNKINHAFKNRNSAFPEIEQKISELFDEAEAEGRQLSSKVVRQKALEYADMLGIKNFNASKGILSFFSSVGHMLSLITELLMWFRVMWHVL